MFLTADGRTPESGGELSDKITSLRYHQIVAAFQTECKTVQAFLSALARYVQERIDGEAPASHPCDKRMIDDFLRPENIEVTVEILTRATEVRRELVASFLAACV